MKDSQFRQDTYQTGSTRPPKSYGGLIAFLMVLVIFLCGVSTALGLMNIRLLGALRNIAEQEPAPAVAFSGHRENIHADEICFSLGFYGQEVPEIWRVYQDLPTGIYITDVNENSDAAAKGVLPGDILLQLNGQVVTNSQQLHDLLTQAENSVQVVLYRKGEHIELTILPHN